MNLSDPWQIALAAGLAAILPVLVALLGLALPLIRKWLQASLKAKDAQTLKDVVHGAFIIVSTIAKQTTTTLDDSLAKLLEIADAEFQLITGRPMSELERARAEVVAVTMHADPAMAGDLGRGDLSVHAARLVAISTPAKPTKKPGYAPKSAGP